jgi:hypothetical protein
MNHGKKLVGMVEKKSNTTPKNCILIKHKKNEIVENWSSTRNGIEVDLNRINGVDIDDLIIEFSDNNKTNNNIEESDNILENNSLNLVYEQTVDNIVILDTQNVEEISGLKINTIDTFEVLENNLCSEITKDITILDTQLYEKNDENEQFEEKNDHDNQDVSSSSVNYIVRDAKQKIESKKKGLQVWHIRVWAIYKMIKKIFKTNQEIKEKLEKVVVIRLKGQRALKASCVVHSLKMIDRMCSTNFGK